LSSAELVEVLKLKVNPKKSKVERVTRAKFLGFTFLKRKGEVFIRLANRTKESFAEKMRRLTRQTRTPASTAGAVCPVV